MRRLILLRHAKSDKSEAGMPDHARPLNGRGREAAKRIGAYMAHHDLKPDLVLCSTAERTRETWTLVAKELPRPPAATYEERLYDSTAGQILSVLREAPAEKYQLLVIGHNPGLHELAVYLIAAGDVAARERLRENLPTGGLVVIEFAIEDWKALHRHAGRLERFIEPRTISAATD
jgi:phosphohistidine phosphatase